MAPAREPVEIQQFQLHYLVHTDALNRAAAELESAIRSALDQASIPTHSVDARAKSYDSFVQKSEKRTSTDVLKYDSPLEMIKDCIAARVIVYTTEARSQTVDELAKILDVVRVENPGDLKYNGYDSDHIEVSGILEGGTRFRSLAWFFSDAWTPDARAEIQVRTVAGHAWAEYEHDVRYKPSGYEELSDETRAHIDQLFTEAGGFRREIDRRFAEIDALVRPPADTGAEERAVAEARPPADPGRHAEILTVPALASFLEQRYRSSEGPGGVAELVRLSSALEILGVGASELETIFAAYENADAIRVYKLMRHDANPTGARRLEDDLLYLREGELVGAMYQVDERYADTLELRRRRLNSRYQIYTVAGLPDLENKPFTAAGLLRELVKRAVDIAGLEAVLRPGYVASTRDDVGGTRVTEVVASNGAVWVNANLDRHAAEEAVRSILPIFARVRDVQVYRAGVLIGSS